MGDICSLPFLALPETGRQETFLEVAMEDSMFLVLAPKGEGHPMMRSPQNLLQ